MPKTPTSFSRGNSAARKTAWTDDQIRAYQVRVQTLIDALGLDEVCRLMGYQPQYIRLMAGYYDETRQPSEPFVVRFKDVEFLHHIRTVAVPFLREREQQQPAGQTWTRERARIKKQRQKGVKREH